MNKLSFSFNLFCMSVFLLNALPMQGMEPVRDSDSWKNIGKGFSSDQLAHSLTYDDATALDHIGSCLLHGFVFKNCDVGIDDPADFFEKAEILVHAIPGMINALNCRGETPVDAAYIGWRRAKSQLVFGSPGRAFQLLIILYKNHGGKTGQALLKENMILLLHKDDDMGDLSMLLHDVRKYIVQHMMLFFKQVIQQRIDMPYDCSICMNANKS